MYHKAHGLIETFAPLHVGASAGEETGNLNLIFRDQFTQTGIIPGSSIRGRFRADMRETTIIKLFHDNIFKTTPAIGGRQPNKDGTEDNPPKFCSSVWHRMLPIEGSNQYLEIITLFTSKEFESDWEREIDDEKVNQLQPFIEALKNQQLDNKNFEKVEW
jgi:CRISPR/Cas system CSM-associated protein Csm3 (group 7 of RAMP superfamily)